MEVSCFVSLHWLLEAAVLSSHMQNNWGLGQGAEIPMAEHVQKGLDLVPQEPTFFLKT